MKRRGFVLLIVLLISLSGCGSSEVNYSDDDFLKSMATGLEKRWDLTDQEDDWDENTTDDEVKNAYESYVKAELDNIEIYKDKQFEDSKLQEYAIKYINLLNQQKEAVAYMLVDYDKYDKLWGDAYEQRAQLITTIDKEYGIPVSAEYEDTMKEMNTKANVVTEKKALEDAINKALKEGKFEKSDNYGSYDCTLIVENTTDADLKHVGIVVNFIDKDDVVVDSMSDYVEVWKAGTKTKLTYYVQSDFDKWEAELDYYEIDD